MMKQLIQDFTKHLDQAIEIGKNASFHAATKPIQNVVLCGLGGSGIGGTIISQLLSGEVSVPVIVNKDYSIPNFVNESTLVICCSYSGNTEETLEMYAHAEKKGAEICIITSGGEFQKIADSKGYNHIIIPGGNPPRAAFGLAFPQLFWAFAKYGLISDDFLASFQEAIQLMDQDELEIQTTAQSIADKINGKLPVIYCEAPLEGVAVRLRQQLNENAKMLAWINVIPEMNHNELVGWTQKNEDLAVLFFKSGTEYYRNAEREKYSKKVITPLASSVSDMLAKGSTNLSRALYLIHLGDWLSYNMGVHNQTDIVEVKVIDGLKGMLSDLK